MSSRRVRGGHHSIPPEKRHKKQKGEKDKVPGQRKIRASVKAIIAEVVQDNSKTVRQAILDGLQGGPRNAHHYLKLAAEYTDGKPDQTLMHRFDEDELATAKDTLSRKLDAFLERVLEQKP